MKDKYRHVGLSRLCRLLGITRQAYYQHFWLQSTITTEQNLVLKEVKQIRNNHRFIGTRKLYEIIQPFLLEHQIKMGRDALFDLLAANEMLVRRKKRRIYTTNSFHWLKKYPNLIKDFIPNGINQLWVSDITYWKINNNYTYISFITDTYSHKIVGYHVGETLEAIESVQALKMALKDLKESTYELYHHSDRGIQYCSEEYVKLLKAHGIKISMTETGDPLDNAIAERINGIIKNEYLCSYEVYNINEARKVLDFAVELYNKERPHMSNGNLTPNHIHENGIKTERLWKNYYQKNIKLVNLLQDEELIVN
jgi:putative transposase